MMPDVVIIEDESVLREVLVEGLSGALPGLSFCEYGSVEEAVVGIENEPPRLIISDVRLPGKSGVDLLIDVQRRWPSTQFILMTAFATLVSQEQAYEYGALRLLRKPFALADLTRAVERALREEAFAGKFRGISLMDLMQVINLGQKTLAIDVQYGKSHAEIFFRDGEIVHVKAEGQDGVKAFNELVRWQGGLLDVRYGKEPPKISIRQPFQHLMLEAMRLLDHEARERQGYDPASRQISGLAEDDEQSFAGVKTELGTRDSLSDPDPLDDESEALSSPSVKPPHSKVMSQIDFDLLRSLGGFVAAALADSESGLTFSSEVAGTLDIERTSIGHAEMLRLRRKLLCENGSDDEIEDVLVSLKRRYHILRPLEQNNSLFLYAIFDRAKANLAVARQALRNLERQLQADD